MFSPLLLSLLFTCSLAAIARTPPCKDSDMNCPVWVATDPSVCDVEDSHAYKNCAKACQRCGKEVPPEYDLKKVPKELAKVAFLIGKWRSEFGGKAFFPTIPKFTYGEELDIKLTHHIVQPPTLNYTAFAWDAANENITELHSENGYLAAEMLDEYTTVVHLTTAMSNGFMTIEQGEVMDNAIKFKLERIGRISFSHDSAVRLMFREWTLLDENRLEARLLMTTTVTRHLMEHTAFAWDAANENITELHSENGYLAAEMLDEYTTVVHLTTAMSNGFMTIEQGEVMDNSIKFKLERIGRISFSHDSAARLMFREWTLLDENRLEARLLMTTTVTRHLMEHTSVIYKRVSVY